MRTLLLLFTSFLSYLTACSQDFSYTALDSTKQKWGDWDQPEWLRYFGLDAGDIDGDGLLDVVSGRYVYYQPQDASTNTWERTVLDDNVDGIFITDVDRDRFADIIAQALPSIYWYEAVDIDGKRFVRRKIAEVPATTHVNSQGFERAQVIPGGTEEILIAGNGNVYLIPIPENPDLLETWPTYLIASNTSDEGIGVGDLDGDGDLDIACGRRPPGSGEPLTLVWFENTGSLSQPWKDHPIGHTEHPIDRIKIADLNGDDLPEIILTEERYPGLEPDSRLMWFSRDQASDTTWDPHIIATQYSSNNLDLADMDGDGDMDIVTAEHKGQNLELQLWLNNGMASFEKRVLDTGKENHLGAKIFDMDGDGDLDILGAGWDQHQWVHLWRNTAKSKTSGQPTVDPLAPKTETAEPRATEPKTEKAVASEHTSSHHADSVITQYQGRDHFLIKTKRVTYYYDLAGGGFSRMIDDRGNDWISFKANTSEYPQGAAGVFRGIPNLVYQGEDNGAGHPGFDRCHSWFENGELYSETNNGKWKWRWTFDDDFATLEILKADPDRSYWFLYEGTPGGSYRPDTFYYGYDGKVPSTNLPDFYKEDALFLKLNWAYAGVKDLDRTFYMVHDSPNPGKGLLSYLGNSKEGLKSQDGMTVFGFGRNEQTQPLLSGENRFVIGLYPREIKDRSDYNRFADYIKSNIQNR